MTTLISSIQKMTALAALTVMVSGCQNPGSALKYGASGALIGAGVGAAALGATSGCIPCGAAIGAAVGAGVGLCFDIVDNKR